MASNNIALNDPTVHNYASDLSKVKILDKKTELEFFRRYKENNDIEARNKMIESGLRFVVKVAQKYSKDLEHQKALISAGNEGLLVAVDRYDPTRGTRFLSYATWWIVLHIREEIHKSSVVAVPIWRKKSARKVQTVQDQLKEKLGREATYEEIHKETGFSVNQIKDVLQDKHQVVPLDFEPEPDAQDRLEESTINKSADRLLSYLLMSLPVRERFIVQAYYGFITDEPMSLKNIATVLCISSERVRQIKIEALATLKKLLSEYQIHDLTDIYEA